MKFISIERVIVVIMLSAAVYGSVTITNAVRDYEVYKNTAVQCSGDKGILQQEIEQLQAANNLKDDKVESLKSLPLR